MNHAESNCSLTQYDIEAAEAEIPAAHHALNANEEAKSSSLNSSRLTQHLLQSVPASDSVDSLDKFGIDGGVAVKKSYSFSPSIPPNSPVVLSWQNLTVATTTATPKVLLDNISGSITGGFWAIMGASGGGDHRSNTYYSLTILIIVVLNALVL